MATKFLVVTFTLSLLSAMAHAASSSSGQKSSSSSSSSSNTSKAGAIVEVSGGTSQLDQFIATDHVEHPLGYHLAGRFRLAFLHAGVGYLALHHADTANQSQPGVAANPAESDVTEDFQLTTFDLGIVIDNWLILSGGYGYAQMSRSENMPYAASVTKSSYSATSGTGWIAGRSLVPIHISASGGKGNYTLGLGASGYYFDATASDYSSDVINGATETTKSSGNGSVHTKGWYAGITLVGFM